jgi:broad specificity phosphatase PhoE
VVLADAARVRLFTFDEARARPMREEADLIDPERRLRMGALVSTSRPERGTTATGRDYPIDDRRAALREKNHRALIARAVEALDALRRGGDYQRVVLVAGDRTLGLLRQALAGLAAAGGAIDELPIDLTRATPSELHDRLGRAGLVPSRSRIGRRAAPSRRLHE